MRYILKEANLNLLDSTRMLNAEIKTYSVSPVYQLVKHGFFSLCHHLLFILFFLFIFPLISL